MSVGERICDLRKKQNISQAELAKIMNVSRQAVSKWENDLSSPDTLNLIHLADVLDSNVEYLATGRISVSPSPALPIRIVEQVEKIVEIEKPIEVVKVIEVEKPVETIVERPVIRKVVRVKYIRNPIEFILLSLITFALGLIIGFFI